MKSINVFGIQMEKFQTGFDLVLDFRTQTVDQVGKIHVRNGQTFDNRVDGKFITARNGGAIVKSNMPKFTSSVNDLENEYQRCFGLLESKSDS